MVSQNLNQALVSSSSRWLGTYYFLRAAVAIGWIALAVAFAKNAPVAAGLLVAYPAWDALANYLDAQKSGGLRANFSQALNLIVSLATAAGVVFALRISLNAVIVVFGVWAILSGLFQLVTAIRRWKTYGAQWVMILSGAQSALAGIFFFKMATAATPPGILSVAPYAGFGAFYFLVSAIWLSVKAARKRSATLAG